MEGLAICNQLSFVLFGLSAVLTLLDLLLPTSLEPSLAVTKYPSFHSKPCPNRLKLLHHQHQRYHHSRDMHRWSSYNDAAAAAMPTTTKFESTSGQPGPHSQTLFRTTYNNAFMTAMEAKEPRSPLQAARNS
jgi:hypothetical protein